MPLSNLSSINPRLQYAQQWVNNALLISLEKAAAHLEDPAHYPLPAGNDSLEASICALVNTYSKKHRDRFLDKLKAKVHQTAAQRKQHYGDLAAIDLHKAVSVEEQVLKIVVPENMKITEEDATQLKQSPDWKNRLFQPPHRPGTPRQAAAGTALQVSMESITCDETNDLRKDEISLSAFIVSSNGTSLEKNAFFSTDIKKNESKDPGAAGDLFTLALDDSSTGGFPVTFTLTLLLTEKDFFHNTDRALKVGVILKNVGRLVNVTAGVLSFIPAVGAPLCWAMLGVGTFILALGYIFDLGADDQALPVSDVLLLEAAPLAGEIIDRTVDFQFRKQGIIIGGKYTGAIRYTVA